ncbi:hypothetical protein JCM3765_000771 [Sporobolomyces pararoseus]
MALPPMPLELVTKIASCLKENSEREAIDGGKALSLVCRRWRSIGQALRWSQITISLISIPSLSIHFSNHSQLSNFVRRFTIKQPLDLEVQLFLDREAEIQAHFSALLPSMSQIRYFTITILRDEHLLPTVQAVSALKGIKSLELYVTFAPTWTKDIESTFRKAFKNLKKLTFLSSGKLKRSPNSVQETDSGAAVIPVEDLCWSSNDDGGEDLGPSDPILSLVDRKTLRKASTLFHNSLSDTLISLSAYTSLTELNLQLYHQQVIDEFPKLLALFSQFPALLHLVIGSHRSAAPEREEEDHVESPVALSSLLASLPSSLQFAGTKCIHFHGSETITGKKVPRPIPKDYCIYLNHQEENGESEVKMFWRDKSGSSVNWYRTIPG